MAQAKAVKILGGDALLNMASSFAAALQAYKIRATACGQSFEHMVLLEAAVQGWHVTALLLVQHYLSLPSMHARVATRRTSIPLAGQRTA